MKEIAGRKVIILNQVHDEDTSVATIVVRASTENLINDVERALDDGIQSVKTLCTDGRLLPGAGKNCFFVTARAVYCTGIWVSHVSFPAHIFHRTYSSPTSFSLLSFFLIPTQTQALWSWS